MTNALSREFLGRLLNALEDRELPLLSWGITDRALSEDEVMEVLFAATLDADAPVEADPQKLLKHLVNRGLLFRVPGTSPTQYRTRFAEALRLTANLRQLFPYHQKHGGSNWWMRGPALVADYRLHTAKRRYPKRDVSLSDALGRFRTVEGWGTVQDAIAEVQIGARSLSAFQVAATTAVFSAFGLGRSSGVIVGAGTGSGKTLSFYLPAFASMADVPRHRKRDQLHTLAIYPRKELLRDQLRDAVANALSLGPILDRLQRRPLRIGALYADTPPKTDSFNSNRSHFRRVWTSRADGLVCPYLSCPACMTGDLLWSNADRKAGREILRCLKCQQVIPEGLLALTRRSLREQPPDLLFTTTEQLNRNSSNDWLGGLLGWSGNNSPKLVLLDEVHTYSGTQGAQVALLLRRWRHAVRTPVTFVGLSATLKDAGRFFAGLTGLSDHTVEYIHPAESDMEDEGREYSIALRSDPTSGASHLSTSIQTSMLWGRVLDVDSEGSQYGSTGFLFTDDLDVTNRFYNNLRDAEGGQSRSGYRSGRRPVLAGLRATRLEHRQERLRDGQSWDLVEHIGHPLDGDLNVGELRIARTSSQDAGMDLHANLTVATASLEVGFNDPRVGLVVQHKAPYDAAAFIQRRGRAGRTRGTRPITIVTLSDYGRDRLSYQGYETLFAPELTARSLPINNRYVLKIQAAQSLLDWLASRMRAQRAWGDPRALLTAPGSTPSEHGPKAVEALTVLLERLLKDRVVQDDLARHLTAALKITPDDAQAILWEEPRSLLLAVVPTSLRRLKTNWKGLQADAGASARTMLPEYITRSLFEPLNTPEVEFILPFDTGGAEERLPVAKALREAVPGRISKRYGYQRDEHRTWIPLPEQGDFLEITDELVPSSANEGRWRPANVALPDGAVVLRPYQLRLSDPPPEIADRAQGTPLWASEIHVPDDEWRIDAPAPLAAPWSERIRCVGFHTHAMGNPAEVRRMTYGADCDTAYNSQKESVRRTVRYTFEGEPAALGFQLEADAMRIELEPLDLEQERVRRYLASPSWRSQAFFRAVAEDEDLMRATNSFKRGWLSLIYMTAFALGGLDGSRSPKEVRAGLSDGSWGRDLPKIFSVLYRQENVDLPEAVNGKLASDLDGLSHDPLVVAALDRAAELLTGDDISGKTADLARRAYRDTLAAAVLAAILRACPDAQEQDLIVDAFSDGDAGTIWISETSVGGLGIIEQLVREYSGDPSAFWSLVLSAMRPNEYEYTDSAVTALLKNIVEEAPYGAAGTAIAALRKADSAAHATTALRNLRAAWTDVDGTPRHSAIATLSTRLLRPGSNPETDATTLRILTKWRSLEKRLGVEIDARVMAYAVGSGKIDVGRPISADQVFSMLWPRGFDARSQHLRHYQPYVGYDRPPVLDRVLLEAVVDEVLPSIDITRPGWEATYQSLMARDPIGVVALTCPTRQSHLLGVALRRIPALPIDRDVLRAYGEVCEVRRITQEFVVSVKLQEAAQ
ncbi:protein DpdJ [Actinocorallia aurantiaca]|uniref:DEAD/DEAH box helicase n=1 Tax=Actinocorallia aurantiaca TaxID=46204 RepID=A0ABP6H7N7_9ACTN